MTKVFALGGSIFTENLENLQKYAEAFESFEEQVVVVTGAGSLKTHIKAVEEVGNQSEQDLVGIKATRLNAQTLKTAMDAYPRVPEKMEEVEEAASTGENVVMGGLVPGYSTDAVAATVAELLDAKLYIATSVDGVYTEEPEKPGAERLEEVTVSELKSIVSGNSEAGNHALIDYVALTIIDRSGIPTEVFEGTPENIQNLESATSTTIE
ncbi:MAG: UMP kinase [Candidatus Nanohaloarchaea archaeon]